MSDRDSTRQMLITKAIELIERVGLGKVTVRALAKEADVNVAAVNYYFGSKEKLVELAIEQTLAHLFEDLATLVTRAQTDPSKAVAEILLYLYEGSLRYPNITRAHLHKMFVGCETSPFSEGMGPVINALADATASIVPLPRDRALNRVVLVVSAVLFPGFFAGFFTTVGALRTPKSRHAYVEEVVAALLAPDKKGR